MKKITKSELALVLSATFELMEWKRVPRNQGIADYLGIKKGTAYNRGKRLQELGFISSEKMELTEKGQRLYDCYERLTIPYSWERRLSREPLSVHKTIYYTQYSGLPKVKYFAGLIEQWL